jgi:hypothetical protein
MAFSKAFERKLDSLFHQRTNWLRQELGKKRAGAPPAFGRKKVNAGISQLQDLASDALAFKLAKAEFNEHVASRKGWGRKDKKAKFERWIDVHFQTRKGVVYAFWGSHGKCIYIGRTGLRGSRPSTHFEKYWFSAVRRVTVFSISGASHTPKLECLAIHRFRPTQNKNKAATKRWTKACPLCTTHKYIESELRAIFRLR